MGKYARQPRQKEAPARDEGKLYDSERDWFRKGIKNGFGRSIGQCGAQVPDEA